MFGINFKRQQPFKPIQPRAINQPAAQTERNARLRVNPPLRQKLILGTPLITALPSSRVKARLIAGLGGGKYSWQGVFGTAGGAWSDLPSQVSDLSGTDPAYEFNANANLAAGTIVDLERDDMTGEWRFLYDNCTSASPPPPSATQVPPPGVVPPALTTQPILTGGVLNVGPPPYLNSPIAP